MSAEQGTAKGHVGNPWCADQRPTCAGCPCICHRPALDVHRVAESVVEWGVRYPSGRVESHGQDEFKARRFARATTALRPDLPTLVVRQVVTPWEVSPDA